jgi:signal transduction histidine kinase
MSARTIVPGRWLRLPRRTARLRLTLLYSGLFMALGTVLIAIIFLLAGSGSISAGSAVAVVPEHVVPGGAAAVRLTPMPIGIARQQHNADIGRLLEVSWVVLVLTAIGSAVLGWFAAGRVLAPLRSITTTARTISAGSLHQRLAIAGPDDEFKQLGDTLDELLARLEASFESQRRFVANASHELRTPLTVERTLLQDALADPNASAEELRATCEEVLAAGAEQERLLEALLTLASSERGLDRREPLDLARIAGHALLAAEPARKQRSLELTAELAPAPTAGDPGARGALGGEPDRERRAPQHGRWPDRDPDWDRRGRRAADCEEHRRRDRNPRDRATTGALPAARRPAVPPTPTGITAWGSRSSARSRLRTAPRSSFRHHPKAAWSSRCAFRLGSRRERVLTITFWQRGLRAAGGRGHSPAPHRA